MINKVHLGYEVWTDRFPLVLMEVNGDSRAVAMPLTMQRLGEASTIGQPTAELDSSACQLLFQALWDHGFRPKDGSGNSGHIGALTYHLEDMRKLVFREKK